MIERNLIKNIESNFDFVEKYLRSTHLYVLEEDLNYFIVDSMVPIRSQETGMIINNQIDDSLLPKFEKNISRMEINCNELSSLQFVNHVTGEELELSDITCIKADNSYFASDWQEQLDEFAVNYQYDANEGVLVIQEGVNMYLSDTKWLDK